MVIGMTIIATKSMTLCVDKTLNHLYAPEDDDDDDNAVQGQVLGRVGVSASSDDRHICSIQTPSDRIASSPHLIKWGGGIVKLAGRKKRLTFLKAD